MQKIRYEVDPHNKLIARKTREKTKVKQFRKVFGGRFKLGKDNSLIYHIKAPSSERGPHQIKFKGRWSLTQNHDLRFVLDKWRRQTFGDKLTIKGDIISVDKNALVFAITTTTNDNQESMYLLELQGMWQADKYNRLSFRLNRERSMYDIFTLRGAWEINKKNQIIYQYEKKELLTKSKEIHTLILKGYWDIKEKGRISYVLDRDTDSAFNFRTAFGIFKDNYIKYELGIGLSNRTRPFKKTIAFFGTWKITENKGLTFETDYGDKRIHSISFGAEARLTDRDSISFKLKDSLNNKDIGIQLKLSRKILKGDGEAFFHILNSRSEKAFFIGMGKRW